MLLLLLQAPRAKIPAANRLVRQVEFGMVPLKVVTRCLAVPKRIRHGIDFRA